MRHASDIFPWHGPAYKKNPTVFVTVGFLMIYPERLAALLRQVIFFLEDPPYCKDLAVIRRRGIFNSVTSVACMDNCIVSNINCNMSAVTYDIARLHLGGAHAIPNAAKRTGAVRKADSKGFINTHDKTGAVCSVCKA